MQEQAGIAGKLKHLQAQKEKNLQVLDLPGSLSSQERAGREVDALNGQQAQLAIQLAGFVVDSHHPADQASVNTVQQVHAIFC